MQKQTSTGRSSGYRICNKLMRWAQGLLAMRYPAQEAVVSRIDAVCYTGTERCGCLLFTENEDDIAVCVQRLCDAGHWGAGPHQSNLSAACRSLRINLSTLWHHYGVLSTACLLSCRKKQVSNPTHLCFCELKVSALWRVKYCQCSEGL